MRILVLGGAGFIGTNFVRYLPNINPDAVAVADKLTYAGKLANIESLLHEKGWEFHRLDICNSAEMNILMKTFRPTVVVNFAAETHVSRSITGPQAFTVTNVVGVQVVMEAIRHFAPKTRLVHISTDEVFGHLSEWEEPWSDYAPLNPRSPYAASKAAGELLARSYFTTYGTDIVVVRPSNCFGPYQFPEKLIPRSITNLIEGKNIQLMGPGNEMRDWLYVGKLCKDLGAICRYGKSGEAYNIPGNNIMRNREMVEKILSFMNMSWERVTTIPSRLAHDFKYHVDGRNMEKLRDEDVDDSCYEGNLFSTFSWYQDNEAWWKPLKEEAERGNENAHTGG